MLVVPSPCAIVTKLKKNFFFQDNAKGSPESSERWRLQQCSQAQLKLQKTKKLYALKLVHAEKKKTQTFCREANFENLKSFKTEHTIQGWQSMLQEQSSWPSNSNLSFCNFLPHKIVFVSWREFGPWLICEATSQKEPNLPFVTKLWNSHQIEKKKKYCFFPFK